MTSMLSQCQQVLTDVDPLVLAAPDVRWVIDLKTYRQLCAETGRTDIEPDPEKWVPDPADRLFGMQIEVREDGVEPHLESKLATARGIADASG